MKKYFYFAAAMLMLASCANEDFVGENEEATTGQKAIDFNSGTFKVTRASGLEDATAGLGTTATFKVYGTKTVSGANQDVFPNYTVSYGATAYTDVTNPQNWSYLTSSQTVKYWDYAATKYDYYAAAPATVGTINPTGWDLTVPTTGNWFVTDKTTVTSTGYGNTVTLAFRNGKAKLKLGIYENVPGYAVKDVEFYVDNTKKDNATLAGTVENVSVYTVTYDTNGQAVLTAKTKGTAGTSVDFGTFTLASSQTVNSSADAACLSSASSAPTYAATLPTVMPVDAANAHPLTLKVNYKLYSADTNETIQVTGATATVPAAYTAWQANYQYTYLFKISDNTNGYTGSDASKAGLYPITFDAVVEDAVGATQETTTIVDAPSITTFGYKDDAYTSAGSTYPATADVYATVYEGSAVVTLEEGTNVNLYTVTSSNDTTYPITEASVEESLAHPTSNQITCTSANDKCEVVSTVPAVEGGTRSVSALKITSAAAATYAVEYIKSGVKTYKVFTVQ